MKTLINEMVNRFLCWKLPKDFGPDAGIRFAPGPLQTPDGPYWPTGTNLLHAGQAQAMFEHCLPAVSRAAQDVLAERRRQVEAEGWMPEHDDEHADGELSIAAACYALSGAGWRSQAARELWPRSWRLAWWKPTTPRRDLVKAAALILAEIERLDRAEAPKTQHPTSGD